MAVHFPFLLVVLSVMSQASATCEVLANGSVWDKLKDAVYNPGDVWDNVTVDSCVCRVRMCVSKCCDRDENFDNEGMCAPSNSSQPSLLLPTADGVSYESYGFVNYLSCEVIALDPINNPDEKFHFLTDGKLLVGLAADRPAPHSMYCVDSYEGESEPHALVCVEWVKDQQPLLFYIYPVFMIISTFCLFATAIAYLVAPEKLSLHKRSVASHACSLTVAYVFLISVYLAGQEKHPMCIPTAFIIYFSFLASFFWLNVMCLDIFWTFSGFRSLRGTVKEREFKKFIIYSIYSWGCPLIMLTVCLVMHFHEGISDDYVKPGFGITACWFKDTTSALAYFYGPVAVLILCNIILFILTAVKIAKLKREAEMFNNSESRRHDDEDNKQRFNLYLKLFLVMGVNWATEIISWAAGGPEYLWYLTDIANTLQGVLIFIIFVWKDRIRKLLMERFCPKRAAAATASKSTAITYSTRGSSSISSVKPGGKINQESLRMTNMVTSEESDVP